MVDWEDNHRVYSLKTGATFNSIVLFKFIKPEFKNIDSPKPIKYTVLPTNFVKFIILDATPYSSET